MELHTANSRGSVAPTDLGLSFGGTPFPAALPRVREVSASKHGIAADLRHCCDFQLAHNINVTTSDTIGRCTTTVKYQLIVCTRYALRDPAWVICNVPICNTAAMHHPAFFKLSFGCRKAESKRLLRFLLQSVYILRKYILLL